MTETAVTIRRRHFTQSEGRTWRRCRRKWWLGTYRRLRMRPELQTPSAASLGTLVHACLEAVYLGVDWQQTLARYRAHADEIYAENAESRADYEKHLELAQIMVEGYLDWLEESGADQWIEFLDTESRVEVPFLTHGDTEVWLLGKLDALIRDKYDDTLGFIDFKTVGSLKEIPKNAPRDEQFLHYTLLLSLLHPDAERPAGGIWRQLRKVKRTARSTPPFYGEHRARFNAEQLESYRIRIAAIIREVLQTEMALNAGGDPRELVPPLPTNDCSWSCEFSQVCPMFDNGDRVEDYLADWYVEGNPLERYADKEETE